MLLGIVLHGTLAYVTFPFWPVRDTNPSLVFDIVFTFIHGFRMPLFFVLSGFFTAMVWRKRGLKALLVQRAKRIFKFLGDSVGSLNRQRKQKTARKDAEKAMGKSEVLAQVNPMLQTLEKALATSSAEFDPSLDFDDSPFHDQGNPGRQVLFMTARAVSEVYSEFLESPKRASEADLRPEDIAWIRSLAALA